MIFILSTLWWIRIRDLWKLPDGRDWLWNLGLVLMGGAMLSKFSIQFSVDGWSCVPSLLFGLRPNYDGGVMKVKKTSFRRNYAHTVVFSAPDPVAGLYWPTLLLETPGHSQASLAQSLVRTLLFFPGSWWAQAFVCALLESVSPVLWKFYNQIPLASKVKFPGGSQSLCQIPRVGNLLWILGLS